MGPKFKPFGTKKFVAPVVKKDDTEGSISGEDEGKKSIKINEDLETYEVMYTKHINQKIKSWEEGLFVYNLKNFKS